MTSKITAIFGIAVMAAILLGGLTFSQSAFAGDRGGGQEKVIFCHVDKETGEKKTITIGAPAVQAHMNNHADDRMGACVDEPEPSTCQECIDNWNEGIDLCGLEEDVESCLISITQSLDECTLTCVGDGGGFPDFCYNEASPELATCLETAVTFDDWETCVASWTTNLVECSLD